MTTITPTLTQTIAQVRADAYSRALARAKDASLAAYINADGSYSVPSASHAGVEHVVTVIGSRWFDLSCDCAGAGHPACQHRAVVVFARKYGVHAKRTMATPAVNPLHTFCQGCGAESFAGVVLCIECCAEQKRLYGAQPVPAYVGFIDSSIPNLPVHLQAEAARMDAINARAALAFAGL